MASSTISTVRATKSYMLSFLWITFVESYLGFDWYLNLCFLYVMEKSAYVEGRIDGYW